MFEDITPGVVCFQRIYSELAVMDSLTKSGQQRRALIPHAPRTVAATPQMN
jgi:hypothetical protein